MFYLQPRINFNLFIVLTHVGTSEGWTRPSRLINSDVYAAYKPEGEIVPVCNDTRQRDWPTWSAQIDETPKIFWHPDYHIQTTLLFIVSSDPRIPRSVTNQHKIYIRTSILIIDEIHILLAGFRPPFQQIEFLHAPSSDLFHCNMTKG